MSPSVMYATSFGIPTLLIATVRCRQGAIIFVVSVIEFLVAVIVLVVVFVVVVAVVVVVVVVTFRFGKRCEDRFKNI